MQTLQEKIERLQGPILVLGASGFIGANIYQTISKYRNDCYGTTSGVPRWRCRDESRLFIVDLTEKYASADLYTGRAWNTVFDCYAYGAYPFQNCFDDIVETNLYSKKRLIGDLARVGMKVYIHAGTSSEYGSNSAAPIESADCIPNSDYALSKLTWGRTMRDATGPEVACCNLRLYSVYGPYEDGSRLIPQVIQHGVRGDYPPFVRPDITRDFVYVDDVAEAFIDAANNLKPEDYGGSFNIGRGISTEIAYISVLSKCTFRIKEDPEFSMPKRDWDHNNKWYANPSKAKERLGWSAKTTLLEGFQNTLEWYRSQGDNWQWPTIAPQEATQKKGICND